VPDFITLKAALSRAGRLDEVGVPAYVASLTDGVPRSANVEHYCGIVRELARQRAVIHAASAAAAAAYDGERTAARVVDDAISAMLAGLGTQAGGMVTEAQAVASYAASLDEERSAPIPTGFADVDRRLGGGLRRRDFVIVAARPSTGKTAFALQAADHVATRTGLVVPFFSLEMDQRKIGARLLASRAQVQTRRLERGEATDEEWARVREAVARPPVPLLIEENASTTAEMEAWCRRTRQQHGDLGMVVVDYMQLLAPERHRESSEAEMAGISRALKRMAKRVDAPVLALSQLSRAPEKRRDKRPLASDLRGSGALEQDCDVLLLLHRAEMYGATAENEGVAEIICAKQRDGPVGVDRLQWHAELAEFRDLAEF